MPDLEPMTARLTAENQQIKEMKHLEIQGCITVWQLRLSSVATATPGLLTTNANKNWAAKHPWHTPNSSWIPGFAIQ